MKIGKQLGNKCESPSCDAQSYQYQQASSQKQLKQQKQQKQLVNVKLQKLGAKQKQESAIQNPLKKGGRAQIQSKVQVKSKQKHQSSHISLVKKYQ